MLRRARWMGNGLRLARSLAWFGVLAILMGACAIDAAELPEAASPTPTAEVVLPSATPDAGASATPAPPSGPQYSKLRVFVASENTEQVWVLEGAPKGQFALVGKIPVGSCRTRWPCHRTASTSP